MKKNRLSKIAIVILLCTVILPITTTQGAWTLSSSSGDWDYTDLTDFGASDYNTLGQAPFPMLQFTQTVQNFSGYTTVYNLTAEGIPRSFMANGITDIYFVIALSIPGTTQTVAYSRQHIVRDWPYLGTFAELHTGTSEQYYDERGSAWPFGSDIGYYNIFGFAIGTNFTHSTTQTMFGFYDPQAPIVFGTFSMDLFSFQVTHTEIIPTNPNFYLKDVTVTVAIAYAGSGTFRATQLTEGLLTAGAQPQDLGTTGDLEFNPGPTDILTTISNFFNNVMGLFQAIIGAMISVGKLIFAFIQILIPYAEVLFVLFILDAVITSILDQELKPIGRAGMLLWNVLSTITSKFIDILQAIGQAIPG